MEQSVGSPTELLAFLRKHDLAHLATVTPENKAHATTTFFFVEDDLRFYFLTRYETYKFKNISKNMSIALTVADEKLLQTVQVEGVAKEVDYSKEYAPVVKKFVANLEQNGWKWEDIPLNHEPQDAGYYTFVQITPLWIRWSDYKNWNHTTLFEKHF